MPWDEFFFFFNSVWHVLTEFFNLYIHVLQVLGDFLVLFHWQFLLLSLFYLSLGLIFLDAAPR